MHILYKEEEEVSYSLGDNDDYIDESKDIWNQYWMTMCWLTLTEG